MFVKWNNVIVYKSYNIFEGLNLKNFKKLNSNLTKKNNAKLIFFNFNKKKKLIIVK